MEAPYTLELSISGPLKGPSHLPDWCKYELSFADEKKNYVSENVHLSSQRVINKPFFIDLAHLKVSKPAYIPFNIPRKRHLFLFFMFKGNLLYCTANNKPIIKTQSNTFLMAYYDSRKVLSVLASSFVPIALPSF